MKNKFILIKRIIIKNPYIGKINDDCFLYAFKESGLSKKQFEFWLNNKIMDIFKFTGKLGRLRKCPWCNEPFSIKHILKHGKTIEDVFSIKVSKEAYVLLLSYLRNNHYDALGFLINHKCSYCINPIVKGRENKCAIPESSRNKMRSLNTLNFSCDSYHKYIGDFAIIYKRRPTRR